jgi:hypothetical protein
MTTTRSTFLRVASDTGSPAIFTYKDVNVENQMMLTTDEVALGERDADD